MDILNRLSGSEYFLKIDLKNAYLQILLDDESSALTTITTLYFSLFRIASPATFQQVMNELVHGLKGVEVYQDDTLAHGKTKEPNYNNLLVLFLRLGQVNVSVNPSKCQNSVIYLNFVGYSIDKDGFKPDINCISPLLHAQSPERLSALK